MPTYTFRHKKNGKTKTDLMSISEMEEFERQNPEWEAMCGAPAPGYNVYSMKKPDWFKDKLKAIKQQHQGSTIEV